LELYCGIDWATDHHDVAVVDDDGHVVARGRVGNDAAGFTQLLMLLAEAGDSPSTRSRWGLNRPGFHAHFLSWEGWHDAEQVRREHQGQGGPIGP
jgi:hypothetical protein